MADSRTGGPKTGGRASPLGLGVVATERLRLRRLRVSDATALAAISNDSHVAGQVHFLPLPCTEAAMAALLAAAQGRQDAFFGVFERASGRLAGVVGAHWRDRSQIEIGYWFGVAFHGLGYATEAAGAVMARIRRRCPEARFVAECRLENRASWRVLEKLGFAATGEPGARPERLLLTWRHNALPLDAGPRPGG